MSRMHGKDTRVLLNQYSIGGQISGHRFEHRRDYSEIGCCGDDGERWQPGQISGAVTLMGPMDNSAGLYSVALAAAGVDDSLLVTIAEAGFTVGTPALIAMADLESMENASQVRDAVRNTVVAKPDSGVDMGYLLHALTAETVDGQAASVDNAAGTTNGLVASLHVTAFSGFTGVVFTIEHSTDNAAWSTLVTFTTATGLTSERKTASGTVNRYLRSAFDVTGTGSVTFAVAAARR